MAGYRKMKWIYQQHTCYMCEMWIQLSHHETHTNIHAHAHAHAHTHIDKLPIISLARGNNGKTILMFDGLQSTIW